MAKIINKIDQKLDGDALSNINNQLVEELLSNAGASEIV